MRSGSEPLINVYVVNVLDPRKREDMQVFSFAVMVLWLPVQSMPLPELQ
jgi:hypothetical protein